MIANLIAEISPFDIVNQVFLLLAGLGVFLFGIKMMGDSLESSTGDKLRNLFNKISNNRFVGMGIGLTVTAVIQSSSATTVMVVGFVNAGVMTLMQAASVIMGANIGTTITAQIMALESFNVTVYLAALTCVGAFMMMSKKSKVKKIGAVLCGLGMIFAGLHLMSSSMKDFSKLEEFRLVFQNAQDQPWLLFLFGMLLTGLIQSSSATTGILISMASAGLLGIDSCIFAILGINIGTCITTIIAAIGANINAKRAASIHLLFNVFGAVIFGIIMAIMSACNVTFGQMFSQMFSNIQTQIAMFHSFFNIVTTLCLIPFLPLIVKLAMLIFPGNKKKKKALASEIGVNRLSQLDERILETPAIAVAQVKKEILHMMDLAKNNLDIAVTGFLQRNLDDKNEFSIREDKINFLNKEITKYLIKISSLDISFRDEMMVGSYYHVVSDIERIGDYAENIMEYTEQIINEKLSFTPEAISEIVYMKSQLDLLYENVQEAFEHNDLALMKVITKIEDAVDECKENMNHNHISRLEKGNCTPESGAVFISLINNMERIGDHMTNIANSIKDHAKQPHKTEAKIKNEI